MQHDDDLDQVLSREFQNLKKEVSEKHKLSLTVDQVFARYKAESLKKKKGLLKLDFNSRVFQIAAPIAALLLIVVSFGIYKVQQPEVGDQLAMAEKNKEEETVIETPVNLAETGSREPKAAPRAKKKKQGKGTVAQAEEDMVAGKVAAHEDFNAQRARSMAEKAEDKVTAAAKPQAEKATAGNTMAMAKTTADEGEEAFKDVKKSASASKSVSTASLKKERKKLWKLIKKGKADKKTYERLEEVLAQLKDKKGLKKLRKKKAAMSF